MHIPKFALAKLGSALTAVAALGTLALMATAQDFPMHSGNPNRTGLPVDVTGFQPREYNDIGRGFLRWWDPAGGTRTTLDNDENDLTGSASGNPPGSWTDATPFNTVAFNYFQGVLGNPIYRLASLVRAKSASDPANGATATYTFTYSNLVAGQAYEVYFSIPAGPTDVGSINTDLRFPQKFWVVRVTGAQEGTRTDVIDYDTHLGGFVRLGNNGNSTGALFTPTGTTLTVTLYNTAPVDDNGGFLDPRLNQDPTLLAKQVVYADGVQLVATVGGMPGKYAATPIVGRLNAPPPGGGIEPNPWRVTACRNETAVIGDLGRIYTMANVTSYDYKGSNIGGSFLGRLNKFWSWPARRPFDNSAAELNRYGVDKRNWVMAADKNRADQDIQVDNLNGGASATASFIAQPGNTSNIGPDFLQAVAVNANPTEEARYTGNFPEGNYFVEVWLPGNTNLARQVVVEVLSGGVVVDTLELDENAASKGWVRIPFQPTTGYSSTLALPLQAIITNKTNNASDAGKFVYADAVRFVRQADLGVESTPVQVTTTVNTGNGTASRDVTVVAMENGRLYCMDAHGDPATGAPPQVYWTFPTESSTDPNAVPTEDGKDRIAEMPWGFDLSSAMVANVGGQDLLYIASRNGKVYCIEMTGRGDGTTRRRWTYPDDYDPSLPTLPMSPGLKPIEGSVSFGTASGGTPIVIVPTLEGRILALDAAGNPVTKKTTVVWQYPAAINPVIGPIRCTPAVAFGKVYFNASPTNNPNMGHVYAVNEADGTLAWEQDGTGFGAWINFGQSSPVAVPGSMLTNPGGTWGGTLDAGNDRVFVCDSRGFFASIDAATGTIAWVSGELSVGSAGPLRFSYSTQYDNTGLSLIQDVPTVYVATVDGRLTGLNAVGLLNKSSKSKVWGYALAGGAQVATMANGGFNTQAIPDHSWLYTGDSAGYLYAFNSINDNSIIPITPGEPPGQYAPGDNEPGLDELNAAIDPNKFIVVSPAKFEELREKADDPSVGITTADITNALTERIDRRNFDYGETLYVLIYGLPTLSGQNSNYYVEMEMSSPGRPSQRNQVPIRPYKDDPNTNYCLRGLPLMTTGLNGVGPGPDFLMARAVSPGRGGLRGADVHLQKPASFNPKLNADFFLANPLAIAFLGNSGSSVSSSSVCLPNVANLYPSKILVDETNPLWALYNLNGNSETDQDTSGLVLEPSGPFGPDLKSKGDPVSHGSTGVQQLYVVDRSLSVLLMGRGLSSVRVGPRDIAWVRDVNSPTGGVFRPLAANGVSYPGFEDYPVNQPNNSVDYPDIGRDNLFISANLFGQAQNPLYQSGVDLNAPTFLPTDQQTYRSKAGYEEQLSRTGTLTVFEMNLNVPRFQPPSNLGYYGSQLIYADYQGGGTQQDVTLAAYRSFGLGVNPGIDQRVVFKSPTVDLGSLPAGGGFNGGPSGGPADPWASNTAFSPWNPLFNNLFQTFTFSNEGNVNLLNVRAAKFFFDANGNRPVELFMPGQHELAWLDASLHLHTSLDPRFSPSRIVGSGGVGFDPQARNILQKPRPRDLIGTRFNVNPKSRPNANLKTVGNYLYDPSLIVPGDPKVGVSAPIGAPAGQYLRKFFVLEDDPSNNPNPDNPSLGQNEPFTDPGANLKFTVRESRLTNMPTQKSAPMVDSLLNGTENFAWSNTQPSAMRDGLGNLFVAWSSNRVDGADNPSWQAKGRVGGDLLNQEKWRIYVGSLHPILGNTVGESPINELNAWNPDTNARWYRQTLLVDPPTSKFDVDTGLGESIDPTSVSFGSPTFPTGGFFNMLEAPGPQGRSWNNGRFMAFIGEARKRDAAGNSVQLSQLMLAPMQFNADGSVNFDPTAVIPSPLDTTSKKSKPSMVHVKTNSNDFVALYMTSFANGLGQIVYQTYDTTRPPEFAWQQGSVRLGSAFENMGPPSAFVRRYRNQTQTARVWLTWTAKVRGRRFSEVYMARMNADPFKGFPQGRANFLSYGTPQVPQIDELTVDTSTGVYWAPGLQWASDQAALDQIDITTDPGGSAVGTVWDGKDATRDYDPASGVLKFNSKFGGEVLIDTTNGSVRLNGAILPRGLRLYVKYRPTIVRVSTGSGANYRSIASAYDDRFIGVRIDPNNPQRNLIGDLQNWVGEINAPTPDTALRWDRTVMAYTRTSGDGTAATRPFFQTLRPGVKLRYSIQTDQNGAATFFQVNSWGNAQVSERYAQFDPATGRVFFMAGCEDRNVVVTYDAVDEGGRYVGRITDGQADYPMVVRLMPELEEQAVPIEQVGNESALSIALDPLNNAFNNVNPQTGRRPGLLWLFWTSSRTGQPDVYFQTVAPRFAPKRLTQ